LKFAKNDFNTVDLRERRALINLDRQRKQITRITERLTFQGEKGWVVA